MKLNFTMALAQISFIQNQQVLLMKNGRSLSSLEKIQKAGMPNVGYILLAVGAGLTFGETP
jgi:H+/gluconate symporter-like permease